jgi:hypothetical protein
MPMGRDKDPLYILVSRTVHKAIKWQILVNAWAWIADKEEQNGASEDGNQRPCTYN